MMTLTEFTLSPVNDRAAAFDGVWLIDGRLYGCLIHIFTDLMEQPDIMWQMIQRMTLLHLRKAGV